MTDDKKQPMLPHLQEAHVGGHDACDVDLRSAAIRSKGVVLRGARLVFGMSYREAKNVIRPDLSLEDADDTLLHPIVLQQGPHAHCYQDVILPCPHAPRMRLRRLIALPLLTPGHMSGYFTSAKLLVIEIDTRMGTQKPRCIKQRRLSLWSRLPPPPPPPPRPGPV
jgi:hypothetical protein